MKAGAVSLLAVMLTGCSRMPEGTHHSGTSAFSLTHVSAQRSGDHVHLSVTVKVKNSGREPLTLTPPAVQLWMGKDRAAAPFIAPGLEPAVIAPGVEAEAATHWWLAASEWPGPLELEVNGGRETVKSGGGISINALAEGGRHGGETA
jgi:hypothetical protein